jgi:hypothetical protein
MPFPRTGEIAIVANFTKSTGNFPPFFFCLFNLLRMARLLQLELLRETLRTVSEQQHDWKPEQKDAQQAMSISKGLSDDRRLLWQR